MTLKDAAAEENVMNQKDKWLQVEAIKRKVIEAIGEDLSHDFRSSHAYQSYTAMCGETYFAFQDGQLDDRLIEMLDEYAQQVIALKRDEAI